jgi:hypothetical protein
MNGKVDVYIHIFLTLALVEGEGSASYHSSLTAEERAHSTHLIWGWVGLRAGLDDIEVIILDFTGTWTPITQLSRL